MRTYVCMQVWDRTPISLMYRFLRHLHSPPNAVHPSSWNDYLKPATSHHFGSGVKHKSSRKISKDFGSRPYRISEQSWYTVFVGITFEINLVPSFSQSHSPHLSQCINQMLPTLYFWVQHFIMAECCGLKPRRWGANEMFAFWTGAEVGV